MSDIQERPSIRLYHYMGSDYLEDFLETDRLKVSVLAHSNDPLEYLPSFGTRKELLEWVNKEDNDEHFVICLSAKCQSPTMWGHYADSHNGVCLAFDLRYKIKDEYISLENDSFAMLIKVSYVNDRVSFSKECDDKSYIYNLIANKSKEWDYESEYRIYVHASPNIVSKGYMTFYSGLRKYLSGIIIGKNSKLTNKIINNWSCMRNMSNIPIIKAELPLSGYKMDTANFKNTEINILNKSGHGVQNAQREITAFNNMQKAKRIRDAMPNNIPLLNEFKQRNDIFLSAYSSLQTEKIDAFLKIVKNWDNEKWQETAKTFSKLSAQIQGSYNAALASIDPKALDVMVTISNSLPDLKGIARNN